MIKIQALHKSYGQQEVLKNISLAFEPGQSIALIGPNGSGKTTLIKSILGLVLPNDGTIEVDDMDIREGPNYRQKIGYMPQITRFPEQMRVQQLFQFIADIRPKFSDDSYDLSLYQDFDIEKMEHKKLGALSGGMKQQVSAALAFYFKPSIIILDEPTAALDPLSNEILKNKINQAVREGKLVLTTSHILNDLEEICNHVVYLMEGEVLFNETMTALRAKTEEEKLNKIVVSILQEHFAHAEN